MIIHRYTNRINKVTLGTLQYKDFKCFTLELPWLQNRRDKSCIPKAEFYKCVKHKSPKHGNVIKILNVYERDDILIHAGNYNSDTKGCILVGNSIKFLNNDDIPDVTSSVMTLKRLLSVLPDKFNLEIR